MRFSFRIVVVSFDCRGNGAASVDFRWRFVEGAMFDSFSLVLLFLLSYNADLKKSIEGILLGFSLHSFLNWDALILDSLS